MIAATTVGMIAVMAGRITGQAIATGVPQMLGATAVIK